ncbi:peptidase M3, partial [Candidatus Symbiopectobacterium sp. NZEC135]|nr:peptidase M3 [Candidatus Symbiopectobacterium sp. NZEC135]
MQQALAYFNALNRDYLAVHQEKEACFWQHYMGIGGDSAAEKFAAAESAYKRFIADPERLKALRTHIAALEALPDVGQTSPV